MDWRKIAVATGTAAGCALLLWVVMIYFNPYAPATSAGNTPWTVAAPAVAAVAAALIYLRLEAARWFMLAAFVWALPTASYLALTPGIFALFGLTAAGFLFSFIFMLAHRSNMKEQAESRKGG